MENTAEVVDTVVQAGQVAAPQSGFWVMVWYCVIAFGIIYFFR